MELGVPADSADMVYLDNYPVPKMFLCTYSEYCDNDNEYQSQCDYPNFHKFTPCWSVGRLIEIALICATTASKPYINFSTCQGWRVTCNIDYMMSIFNNYSSEYMDFSKLEE